MKLGPILEKLKLTHVEKWEDWRGNGEPGLNVSSTTDLNTYRCSEKEAGSVGYISPDVPFTDN